MKYLVQGDPELIEALTKRLKDNGFRGCVGQNRYLFIDRDTFTPTFREVLAFSSNCVPKRNMPEDWNELKNLTPKPEIKVGQYWKFKDGVFRVCSDTKAKLVAGNFKTTYVSWFNNGFKNKAEFVPEDEVEQVLIKEAKRRGFVEGVVSKCLSPCIDEAKIEKRDHRLDLVEGIYDYRAHTDILWAWSNDVNGSITIYKEGEWAKITEEICKDHTFQERIKDLKNDNLSQYQIGWNNAIDKVLDICKS